MKQDSDNLGFPQLSLFGPEGSSVGILELFPEVWGAAELLTHPNATKRLEGLGRLVAINAPRLSPLIAYLVATRIPDPDIDVRSLAIQTIGKVLSPDEGGALASEAVCYHLINHLTHMRTRQVYAILEAVARRPELEAVAERIFDVCSCAGNHLVEILLNRKAPLTIRLLAVRYIGLVGYLDALPALERIQARLESRQAGQQAMPFAVQDAPEENELLPEIRKAISSLHLP